MLKLAFFSSLSLLSALAAAQDAQQVTVTGRIIGSPLQVGGFGDVPLAQSPFAASLIDEDQLLDAGARSISDLTRLDAAVSDAYNAEGYWQTLTVRGFVIDSRYNLRRDGLPINGETALPLDNKQALEVLKGTTGIQAGTSAPGGLVNLVVKRPTQNLRSASLAWREPGSVSGAVDISQRFGTDDAFGLRVNAEYEHRAPQVHNARGNADLLAVAGDWRVHRGTLVEAEFEHSHQSQPSVPGFSLLGDALPAADRIDPRINLNNQPWSLPVVFDGDTGSLRVQQQLSEQWRFVAHGMTQRLVTQDRVAFPFGCSAENRFDRYCSDGTFDLYDYRSEDEHRRADALDLSLAGRADTGTVQHQLQAGVLFSRFDTRLHGQAFNLVGIGNIDGTLQTPADPTLFGDDTRNTERSTEWYLRDKARLSERWSVWAGLRHTRLARDDGSEPYRQQFTTPWIALTRQLTPQTLVYGSWGQGVESEVTPNLPMYTNAGRPLPALKSRQMELGLKHDGKQFDASAALFDIDRPQSADSGTCDPNVATPTCTRQQDGSARHRGAEALLSWRSGPWQLHASGMWLDARRRGSQNPAINGLRPTNVAARTLRMQADHNLAALPGLSLLGALVYEGDRMVLPDNSVRIPGWTRMDLGARYAQNVAGATLTWRVGVENVADKRAWKEAPYQYDHAYLFPMAPRTWRASVQAEL